MTNRSLRLLMILGAFAMGCGSSVTPGSPDAGVTPADSSAAADNGSRVDSGPPVDQGPPVDSGPPVDVRTSCRLPNGGTCLVGQSCPAGDGCNTCSCYGGQETAACTTIGCPPRDGGPSDGPPPMDVVSCEGASVGPNGQYCAGPADGPLPLNCCTNWNCDVRTVMCFGVPPTCGTGEVPVVAMGCYGPCVSASNCAPMPCAAGCPTGWSCNAATGNCRRGA